MKVATIKVVDQEITKVATVEEDEEEENIIREMSNPTSVKSFDVFLVNVMPTRMIHKNLKQSLQCKKIMRAYY